MANPYESPHTPPDTPSQLKWFAGLTRRGVVLRALILVGGWIYAPARRLAWRLADPEVHHGFVEGAVFYGLLVTVPILVQLAFWPLIRKRPALNMPVLIVSTIVGVALGIVVQKVIDNQRRL